MGLLSLLICQSNPRLVQLKITANPPRTETPHFVKLCLEKIEKPRHARK